MLSELKKKRFFLLFFFTSSCEWVFTKKLMGSRKNSVTFMEQMFSCGMMSHETRRMWEREEGMRRKTERERDQGGGGRWRNPHRDSCASEPTGRTNERLETWVKLKSIVQHLIAALWRFFHGNVRQKFPSTWKCVYGSFSMRHFVFFLTFYSDFPLNLMVQFWTWSEFLLLFQV